MADDPPSPVAISKRLSVRSDTSVPIEKNVRIDREGERKAD